MVSEELVQQLKEAYEAWIGGDPGPANAMLADDVSWHVPGNNRISGTYTGVEKVNELWKSLGEHLRGLELHEFFRGEDSIAVSNTITLTSGSAFQVDVWRFRDGKAVEFRPAMDTAVFDGAFGTG